MKRLNLVGRSADGTHLVFALDDEDGGGTFEVPITPSLLDSIEDVAGPADALAPAPAENDPVQDPGDPVPLLPRRSSPRRSNRGRGARLPGGLPPGALQRATGLGSAGGAQGLRALILGDSTPAPPAPTEEAPDRTPRPDADAAPEDAAPNRDDAPLQMPFGNRSVWATADDAGRALKRPADVARLTPGQIQALLRAGRSVRAVAEQAGVSVEWVKRLDETIESERSLVVNGILQARVVRPHLGRSDVPLGEAVMHNLRRRRVAGPERVLERGWSASRSQGRLWRVRLTFPYRGRRRSADWGYDPRRREAVPMNDLAAELGWLPSAEAVAGAGSARAGGEPETGQLEA